MTGPRIFLGHEQEPDAHTLAGYQRRGGYRGLEMAVTMMTPAEVSETRRSNRKVDGRAIRRLLGIELRYPSYRTGIPASLAAETAD